MIAGLFAGMPGGFLLNFSLLVSNVAAASQPLIRRNDSALGCRLVCGLTTVSLKRGFSTPQDLKAQTFA
ncbi:RNA polymerase subunit sigma-24 [Anopheles sinensis]|uniref:RNA polymerase subunit sigma-24 n=1 Tax=Anopheles sinensis TaxID=74873 RepID=A0A084VRM4_ANOSI|nr:RNA polymerase subunit sigma-24 [Anopheles sinensis]